jgi:hypothetical protein
MTGSGIKFNKPVAVNTVRQNNGITITAPLYQQRQLRSYGINLHQNINRELDDQENPAWKIIYILHATEGNTVTLNPQNFMWFSNNSLILVIPHSLGSTPFYSSPFPT